MIKSIEQCRAIQQSRVQQQKFGYAKAVRRFLAKQHGGTGSREFDDALKQLPVSWIKPQKDNKAKESGSVTVNAVSEQTE